MNTQKKILLVVGTFILMILMFFCAKVAVEASGSKKSQSGLESGINYLEQGKYKEAIIELETSINIDGNNEKAKSVLELARLYQKIDEAYKASDYVLVEELLEVIKDMEHADILEETINTLMEEINIIKDIEELEKKVNNNILNNSYVEAIEIVEEYSNKGIEKEHKEKLNALINVINEAKEKYEKDQEKKLEEEKKKKEEQSINIAGSYKITKSGEKNIDGGEIYEYYEVKKVNNSTINFGYVYSGYNEGVSAEGKLNKVSENIYAGNLNVAMGNNSYIKVQFNNGGLKVIDGEYTSIKGNIKKIKNENRFW